MRTCRLCLAKGDQSEILDFSASQIVLFESVLINIIATVQECLSVNLDEHPGIPKTVCLKCIQKLHDWYSFKKKCIESNDVFQLLSTCEDIKEEIPETKYTPPEEDVPETIYTPLEDFTETIYTPPEYVTETIYTPPEEDVTEENVTEEIIIKCEPEEDHLNLYYNIFNDQFRNFLLENVYQCEICEQTFEYCFDYLDHQETHDGELVFKCDICPEVFSYRKDLVDHDTTHKLPCQLCGVYVLRNGMKNHLRLHTDKYKCDICFKRMHCKVHLDLHKVQVHTEIKDFICDTCGKKFSSKSNLKIHLKSHGDARPYKCNECDYAGKTASALYAHASTHKQEVHICEICSNTFKSAAHLGSHHRNVHNTKKVHHCPQCKYQTSNFARLNLHIRIHTGVRPYSCEICQKTFNRSDALKYHMLTHNPVYHDCVTCQKQFTTKRGLQKHACKA